MNYTVGTKGLQPVIPVSAMQEVQWAVASGTSDNITASYAIPSTALVDGLILGVRASAANATTTPQFSPDGLTAATITKNGGAALGIGDIPGALAEVLLRYNAANTRWELLNPSRASVSTSPISDKTSAYTVLNSDSNLTINLGGNACFTVGFNAIGTYSSNFSVTLFNSDPVSTGRAKLISAPGVTNFYLYPQQFTRIVSDNGSSFKVAQPPPGRYFCPNFICYIDSTNGSDSNDGLAPGAGNAFLTIQHGMSFIRANVDLAGQLGAMQLALGTYNENVFIGAQWTGHHAIRLRGDEAFPSGYLLTCPSAAAPIFNIDDRSIVIFQGVTFGKAAAGAIGIRIGQQAICDFTDCQFGSFDGGLVIAPAVMARCNITGNISILGNFVYFAQILEGSGFEFGSAVVTISAVVFTAFLQVVGSGSYVLCDPGLSFTGAGAGSGSTGLKADVQINASVQLNGVTLPGASAATTAAGGVVVA